MKTWDVNLINCVYIIMDIVLWKYNKCETILSVLIFLWLHVVYSLGWKLMSSIFILILFEQHTSILRLLGLRACFSSIISLWHYLKGLWRKGGPPFCFQKAQSIIWANNSLAFYYTTWVAFHPFKVAKSSITKLAPRLLFIPSLQKAFGFNNNESQFKTN